MPAQVLPWLQPLSEDEAPTSFGEHHQSGASQCRTGGAAACPGISWSLLVQSAGGLVVLVVWTVGSWLHGVKTFHCSVWVGTYNVLST